MARRNINSFSSSERRVLARLIGQFADDAVVKMHRNMQGIHGGDPLRFLSFHREYVGRLENWLLRRGYSRFVPLPAWNPSQCIPREFRIRINNSCPNVQFFPRFSRENMRSFASERAFASALEALHNQVHNRVGGQMRTIMTSPAAPVFWIWHAFVDDIWLEYQQARSGSTSGRASWGAVMPRWM